VSDLEAWLGEAPSARRLLDSLGELGGAASPDEVGERAGLQKSSRSKWLGQLRDRELIDGPKHRVRLTLLGRSLANRSEPAAGVGVALDEAVEVFPTVWHRAFLRLALSAVVGRFHLSHVPAFAGHHPGFVAVGPTGAGKSSPAEFVMAVFGLDRVAHTLWLPQQTPGSIFGRREAAEGGGRVFVPATWMERPFVLIEEADKAKPEVRSRVLAYFQGNVEVLEEGERLWLRPTPFLVANTSDHGDVVALVPGEYCRRSVVLDLHHVPRSMLEDLGDRLEAFYAREGPARLRLEDVRPPAERLEADARFVLVDRERGIRHVLTEHGWQQCDRLGLEVMALGRAALLGLKAGDDLRAATLETAIDYLTVAETMPGEALAGFSLDIAAWRASVRNAEGLDELERHMAELGAQRTQAAAELQARRTVRQVEEVELIEARGRLSEQLRLAEFDIRQVPGDLRPEAAGIRDALRKLRERIDNTKRAGSLEELRALAGPPLARAAAIRARLETQKAEADRLKETVANEERSAREERKRQERQATADRSAHASHRKQQKARASQQLADVRALARKLEALYARRSTKPGESPWKVLAQIEMPGGHRVLIFDPPPPYRVPQGLGWWDRKKWEFNNPPPSGHWCSPHDSSVVFAGSPSSCARLASWGADTQRVLEPAIVGLHRVEDQLIPVAMAKPRSRPVFAANGAPALPAGGTRGLLPGQPYPAY